MIRGNEIFAVVGVPTASDEDAAELARYGLNDPGLTIARWRAALATSMAPELLELYCGGLLLAGLQEG